jgi:Flp pilus assembly protein TadG
MHRRSRSHGHRRCRYGVVMVESSVVMPLLLLGMLLMMDLGMRVAQSNSLSDCARHAARYAAIRGAGSAQPLGASEWTGTLAENHLCAQAVRGRLLAMNPEDTSMTITWPDGNNHSSSRVHVIIRYEKQPILAFWSGYSTISAQSTMRILR